jgi:hypothetical protein
MAAADRISAFDCIMPCGIPDKGRVMTQTPAAAPFTIGSGYAIVAGPRMCMRA